MKILIACESSGIVRDAFAAKGHDTWSCDLKISESPGKHLQGHLEDIIGSGNEWNLIIAHPPCTHLSVSGAKHFEQKRKDGRQQYAINFFLMIANRECEKIAIENPIGIMSTRYRKPDQIVHPYYFGDEASKATCLWLKGLPLLKHFKETDLFDEKTHVGKGEFVEFPSGKMPKWYSDAKSHKNYSEIRSRTFPGIAKAMAEQWG